MSQVHYRIFDVLYDEIDCKHFIYETKIIDVYRLRSIIIIAKYNYNLQSSNSWEKAKKKIIIIYNNVV